MKSKWTIKNILVAALLILSTSFAFIQFNQFTTAKQNNIELQAELNKDKEQLQNVKDEYEVIQAALVGVDEDGNAYGPGWADVEENMLPSDPNKVLSTGITLAEAKVLFDSGMSSFNNDKYTDAERLEIATEVAEELGTTVNELRRLPAQETVVEQPSKPAEPSKPSGGSTGDNTVKPTQPSTGGTKGDTYTRQPGVPGTFPKTALDQNGNGIEDMFESITGSGDGYSVPEPGGSGLKGH